jgi:signal transduction histidine kinase
VLAGSQINAKDSVRASRASRYVWLAFTTMALGLAIPGIPRYFELLRSPCDGADCFGPQLTASEARAWIAAGENQLSYAVWQLVVTLTVDVLLLGVAAYLILRQGHRPAFVLAAFVATALATSTLSQAIARFEPALRWPAQGIFGLQTAGLAVLFVLLVRRVISIRREATSEQQEQLVWVLAGLALASPVVLMGGPLRLGDVGLLRAATVLDPFIPLVAGLILAIGSITCLLVALVNYEPLDSAVLINRTLVYGGLTAFVVAGYALVVGYFSRVFASDNVLFSILATGIVALAFQPARHRVQQIVNHMMYGERDEPYRVLARLGEQLESAVEPASVLQLTVDTIAHALRLSHIAIVLEKHGVEQSLAAYGIEPADRTRFPLVHAGERIGSLDVGSRAEGEPLTPADVQLLKVLASQVSVAVHAASLTTDLEHALLRIVAERGEARRRLGSDLHDGVGHRLVGLARQVEQTMTLPDLLSVQGRLADIGSQLVAATAHVRQLSHQLFPPELDVLGLAGALSERALAYPDLNVVVDVPEALPRLPAATEMAAYYIALEALTNVAKHSGADSCRIRLALSRSSAPAAARVLHVDILDNGGGLSPGDVAGMGLLSMRARAAEVGGSCRIEPGDDAGTAVRVRLPCPPDVMQAPSQ